VIDTGEAGSSSWETGGGRRPVLTRKELRGVEPGRKEMQKVGRRGQDAARADEAKKG